MIWASFLAHIVLPWNGYCSLVRCSMVFLGGLKMKRKMGYWKRYFTALAAMSFLTLFYSNCQKEVNFQSREIASIASEGIGLGNQDDIEIPGVQNPPPVIETPAEIQANCENAVLTRQTIRVNFPEPKRTCEWGENGNLNKKNEFFQARIEQKVVLSQIPTQAVVCDLEFKFDQQEFLYDDHFLMTFNDHVLASSYDFTQTLPFSNQLLRYDWDFIKEMKWDPQHKTVYCASSDGQQNLCSWPKTDELGQIQMDFDPAVFYKIMAAPSTESHAFKFITLGDDDDKDCEHSDIKFDVEVRYFTRSQ